MTKHVSPKTLTNRPKAYSYVRFSTPEQMKGDSLRRQTEAAERYAALHGLDLDDKLSFRDLGVSAFTGANEETGRLGEFLAAVEHGDIKRGSYLLVESLDRLSRQKPRKAVKVLERICEAGITVVTLDDQRVYTEEVLDEDPMALIVALMVAQRANEESAKKGRRVGEAWANKRREAKDKPMTVLCPGWVRLRSDRSGFDLIDDRAAVVRRVFDMTLGGKGQHDIAGTLNREGIPVFGRGKIWHRSYIKKMLADPSVVGTFTPHRIERIEGKKVRVPTEPVEGYFPAAINAEIFERAQAQGGGRAAVSKSPTANILASLAKCPQCGSTMTRVNKGGKKGGRPYLVCTVAKAGAGCEYRQVRLEEVESTILEKAELLLATLPAPDAGLQAEWEKLTLHDDVIGEEIERLVAAIQRTGHSEALLARLREQEAAREEIRRTLGTVESRIADLLTNRVQETAGRLVDAAKEEPVDVSKVNATMRQLFDKVEVDYLRGELHFHWKHAAELSSITFAWPKGA